MHRMVQSLYARTTEGLTHGHFRIQGDVLDVFPSYTDHAFRIHFFGDEIDALEVIDPLHQTILSQEEQLRLYPPTFLSPHQRYYKMPYTKSKRIW